MKPIVKPRRVEDIPQSSMADVAFLLLVFFIATTIFNIEQGIPLVLPGKGSAIAKVSPKNVLTIRSEPDGSIFIDDSSIPVHLIEEEVSTRLAENDKLIVSIESHPDSHYDTMVQILDEVKKARAPVINLKMGMGG